MLNVEDQFIIYIDHKGLVEFLNVKYHENIFAYQANKLCLLNIYIQYILRKKNIVTDGLSRIIFNNTDCFSD